MSLMFIVNPAAGGGRARRGWPALQNELQRRNIDFEVRWTEGRDHGTELARQAGAAGYSAVVAVGGDGTLNEVINGVAAHKTAVGLIPLGTGVDFSRTVGLSNSPMEALNTVLAGNLRRVDIGLVNNHRFCNVAGTGFDAKVAHRVNQTDSKGSGAVPYVQALLQTLFTYKNTPFTITIDDSIHEVTSLLMAVGNGRFFGGGMQICPDADIADGHFDVCIVGDVGKLPMLLLLGRVFNGSHMKHPLVTYKKARKVTVHGPADFAVQADGELVSFLPATFELKRAALSMLLP